GLDAIVKSILLQTLAELFVVQIELLGKAGEDFVRVGLSRPLTAVLKEGVVHGPVGGSSLDSRTVSGFVGCRRLRMDVGQREVIEDHNHFPAGNLVLIQRWKGLLIKTPT